MTISYVPDPGKKAQNGPFSFIYSFVCLCMQFVLSEQDIQADCTDKKDQNTNILNKFIYK